MCVALGLYGITRREDADNLMGAALTYTGADGEFHVVDLELDDVKGVFEDAARLLGAKARGICNGPEHAACSHTSGGWARQGVRPRRTAATEPTSTSTCARS